MEFVREQLKEERKTTLRELIKITEDFLRIADRLLYAETISLEEHREMTYIKKDFLEKAKNDLENELCDI